MIYDVYTDWNNPKTSISVYVIWTCIVILLGIRYKLFTKEFIRFGPPKKGQKPIEFLGKKITTWNEVIIIMIYSFIHQLVSNYNSNIINPWITNIIQDPKTVNLNMSKVFILFITNLDNIFGWLNYIIGIAMLYTMELQFIIPKLFASLIIFEFKVVKKPKLEIYLIS